MFTNSKADESLNNKGNWLLFVQNIAFAKQHRVQCEKFEYFSRNHVFLFAVIIVNLRRLKSKLTLKTDSTKRENLFCFGVMKCDTYEIFLYKMKKLSATSLVTNGLKRSLNRPSCRKNKIRSF